MIGKVWVTAVSRCGYLYSPEKVLSGLLFSWPLPVRLPLFAALSLSLLLGLIFDQVQVLCILSSVGFASASVDFGCSSLKVNIPRNVRWQSHRHNRYSDYTKERTTAKRSHGAGQKCECQQLADRERRQKFDSPSIVPVCECHQCECDFWAMRHSVGWPLARDLCGLKGSCSTCLPPLMDCSGKLSPNLMKSRHTQRSSRNQNTSLAPNPPHGLFLDRCLSLLKQVLTWGRLLCETFNASYVHCSTDRHVGATKYPFIASGWVDDEGGWSRSFVGSLVSFSASLRLRQAQDKWQKAAAVFQVSRVAR